MKQVSLVSGIILDIALRAALALPLSFWDDACEAATMSDVLIRTATATDEERCWALLALAFSSDPPCRWAWPDSHQYWETFARFAQAFGGRVVDRGTAHYYEGFSGVALRLPPGTTPDEETLVRIIQETALDARKERRLPCSSRWTPIIHGKLIGIFH